MTCKRSSQCRSRSVMSRLYASTKLSANFPRKEKSRSGVPGFASTLPARDAAHTLERGGVVRGPGSVQTGARGAERDPARVVVQLTAAAAFGDHQIHEGRASDHKESSLSDIDSSLLKHCVAHA